MDREDVVIDCDMPYPILFIPKNATTLETDCAFTDDVYINVNTTSLDVEGRATMIYSGYCNVKLVDSNISKQVENPESSTALEIDQMPVILSDGNQYPPSSQSQVWIDPLKGPYVYNHCNTSTLEQYSTQFRVTRTPTYSITRNRSLPVLLPMNDFECQQNREEAVTTALDSNLSDDKQEEFVSGAFISPKEILNEKRTTAREERNFSKQENNAIKQLMSRHPVYFQTERDHPVPWQ